MSDISKLASKLESVTLAAAATDRDNCPLAHLPYDLVTHHLIPQFANPATLLEPTHPFVQVEPSSLPLRTLARTSKRFRTLVYGQYKTYLQTQYPAVYFDVLNQATFSNVSLDKINWFARVVQAEKLCNRWLRRQFYISAVPVTDPVDPRHHARTSTSNRHNHNNHNNRRIPPYSPCIDISESLNGAETLVLGQGPQLAVRVGEYAPWKVFNRKDMVAGADDIINVHIIDKDHVIASRSMGVELVRNVSGRKGDTLRTSHTNDLFASGVRNPTGGVTSSCLDPSPLARSLAITATNPANDEHKLQIFTLSREDSHINLSKTASCEAVIPSKAWTSTFLTPNTVATGHRTGISLYGITQSGLSDAIDVRQPESAYDYDLAVHSLSRLAPPFSPSILASGWSDGIIRLFDTRANKYVATHVNPISNESAPIYSLCHTSPLSNNLLAGSSMHHAIEIHDLRYAGNMISEFSETITNPVNDIQNKADLTTDGCLLFFTNVRPIALRNNRVYSNGVHSLASTGTGSKVYVGIENNVIQMDFRKRVQGRRWGMGLSAVEKVRKREAERESIHMAPMYWFDREKQRRSKPGDVEEHWEGFSGRWWCGNGKETYRVRERDRRSGRTLARC
ncbi:hypothetical protein TWF694_009305 [Orbilia ellipsospora]|uniref:F-box domain-containing protein n=1 Tax=Orbilia ellipsospora TaxID=2528407 RepID=A0AAV9XF70_9PEZI